MQIDFVAHVSHQLKTPLSLLSAATETLQMDRIRSSEKLAGYLDTIHAEAARLTALVSRVLEFSRVQDGRSYEFEPVDLGALVGETVDAFAHALAGRQVTFDVRQAEPAPYVLADPAALEQVIANLLDNAVKYSGGGKPVVVSVRVGRQSAIVEVTDRGPGISADDRARVFDRFYRAPSASQTPGFGLGLSIARELVQAQGGRIDVSSQPGEGSTFSVTLPCISPPAEPERRPIRWPEAAS
jgi:signal transduction histidine kinase